MIALRSAASRAAPYLLLALIVLSRAAVVAAVYAQQSGQQLFCINHESLKSFIVAVQTAVLAAIILIALLVIAFNALGTLSMVMLRLGEFFTERLRLVFELTLIYVLFLYPLNPDDVVQSYDGCAKIVWSKLFSSGPLFFRLIGWILEALGLPLQPS